MTAPRRPRGATDHDRAARISSATVRVLMRSGLAGLTHRSVAREADVPLGSTTYHFSTRHELIAAALRESIADNERLIDRWAMGLNPRNVPSRLAGLLAEQTATAAGRNQVLVEYELYLAASRDPALRALSRQWDGILRNVLEERVGPAAARLFHAAYAGFLFEFLVSEEPLDQAEMESMLAGIRGH